MAELLLLDDDDETLTWVSAALEGRGHAVRAFTTGREALAALEVWRPALIISDIMMPEIDGLTFQRLARRHRIPLMFVSIAQRQIDAVLAGALGYIQKPATAEETRSAVERVLGRRDEKNMLLVVDDDDDLRSLYRSFLEPHFEVVEAAHGAQALSALRGHPIALAIVDVHMPVMNGIELIRAMRADPEIDRVPVIVQTSDRSALDAPVWRELQVRQVMDKSDFFDWLFARIDAHLA